MKTTCNVIINGVTYNNIETRGVRPWLVERFGEPTIDSMYYISNEHYTMRDAVHVDCYQYDVNNNERKGFTPINPFKPWYEITLPVEQVMLFVLEFGKTG